MNNRYLYRAKRTDNLEWVEGNIMTYNDRCFIVPKFGISCIEQHKNLMGDNMISLYAFEVDPSTICQCTGLKDKNGKLIWENDIMVAHLDDEFTEDVTYKRAMWHNNGFCTHQSGSVDYELIDEFDQNNFEVCENIFDHPELLEVGE